MQKYDGANDLVRNHQGSGHQCLGVELSSYGVPARSRIVHVYRSAPANSLHGDSAFARLQAAARKISRHQAVRFRADQFIRRSASPEICAVHMKKAASSLTKQAY